MTSQTQTHIWHPCVALPAQETVPPLNIVRAEGNYMHTQDGRQIFDAISSWWCKNLGHGHQRLKQAAMEQIQRFEHTLFANTTHDVTINLAQKLCSFNPKFEKVFFASDGASAIECAIKLSLHHRFLTEDVTRKHFISLQHAYHGETLGALSLGDLANFKKPYEDCCFKPRVINNIPYVTSKDDPLWHDCGEQWTVIESKLSEIADTVTAVIVEPLVQGSGGMKVYSADFLGRLYNFAKANDIHVIADEVMTGFGRLGKMFACEHADITPDLLCVGKGLTAGYMPMSAVIVNRDVLEPFMQTERYDRSFLHSHTYGGHALAAAVANAAISVIENYNLCAQTAKREDTLREAFKAVGRETGLFSEVRALGGIVAADIANAPDSLTIQKVGYENGILLRPLGRTLYWAPPLNINENDIQTLQELTIATLRSVSS